MYPSFESSLSRPYPIGWHIPLLIFQVEPYRIGHNPSPTHARTRTHPSGFHLLKKAHSEAPVLNRSPCGLLAETLKRRVFRFFCRIKEKNQKESDQNSSKEMHSSVSQTTPRLCERGNQGRDHVTIICPMSMSGACASKSVPKIGANFGAYFMACIWHSAMKYLPELLFTMAFCPENYFSWVKVKETAFLF